MVNETICDICGETIGVRDSFYRFRRSQAYHKKEKENEQDVYDLCSSCDDLIQLFIQDSTVEVQRKRKVDKLQKQREEMLKDIKTQCSTINKVLRDLEEITKGHEDLRFYAVNI